MRVMVGVQPHAGGWRVVVAAGSECHAYGWYASEAGAQARADQVVAAIRETLQVRAS